MKKFIYILTLFMAFSLTAFAATYKVNSKGTVITPSGKVQQTTKMNQTTTTVTKNYYNTYNNQQYVSQKKALAGQIGIIDIVIDFSPSMLNAIQEAKNTMASIVAQLPDSTQIGLRAFGHNSILTSSTAKLASGKILSKITSLGGGKYKAVMKEVGYLGDITSTGCRNTAQIVPVSAYNSNELLTKLNTLYIGSYTPLTYALYNAAYVDLGTVSNIPKKIILITDGGETCGGDPCAFAKDLMSKRSDIHIDIVLVEPEMAGYLSCVTTFTKGTMYTISDVSALSEALSKSMQNIPPDETNTQTQTPTSEQYHEYVEY